MKTYKSPIISLFPNQIAVCGTNTQGRHGKGAALWCRLNAGLKYGHKLGLCNQSYGIITKDLTKQIHPSISKADIVLQIALLYTHAENTPNKEYLIMYTDHSNLNSYTPEDMAKMFKGRLDICSTNCYNIPSNIVFEESFAKLLNY